MENNIKLTNFTKSKEIRSYLERQFSKEFNKFNCFSYNKTKNH